MSTLSFVDPAKIGVDKGNVHAASLLVWNRLAELCGVPTIPTEVIAEIPWDDACAWMDGQPLTEHGWEQFGKAAQYANAGGFWRTELCAPMEVKVAMARGLELPAVISFTLDDCRMFDIHQSMASIKVLGRPRLEPERVGGYPLEFRVFHGGEASDGAVSFYYPQASEFEVSTGMDMFAGLARSWALAMHRKREELGLLPIVPCSGIRAGHRVGSTIDFMVIKDAGMVMVDAGPGFGYGAHPCCFEGREVAGVAWRGTER